jgi:hypothetical protein
MENGRVVLTSTLRALSLTGRREVVITLNMMISDIFPHRDLAAPLSYQIHPHQPFGPMPKVKIESASRGLR